MSEIVLHPDVKRLLNAARKYNGSPKSLASLKGAATLHRKSDAIRSDFLRKLCRRKLPYDGKQ